MNCPTLQACRAVTVCALLAALASCAGSSREGVPPNDPKIVSSVVTTGNWHIMTKSEAVPGNVSAIMGELTTTDNEVTGTVQIWVSGCFMPDYAIRVSGHNNDGTLTLSASAFGQLIRLTTTLAPNGGSMSGTYAITGGCAGGDYGTLVGFAVPDLSGNWTGALMSYYYGERTKSIKAMNLSQRPTSRGDGWFEISGTAELSDSSCFTLASVKGAIIGRVLVLELTNASNSAEWLRIVAHTNDVGTQAGTGAKPLTGWIIGSDNHYIFFGGECDSDEGTLILTKSQMP